MMIAIVLTFAFSQIFLLVHSIVGSNVAATTVLGSLAEFWKMLFANFKHVFGDGFEQHKENIIVEICSLVAALAITIVLVNMLIASMGETFERVRYSKESECVASICCFLHFSFVFPRMVSVLWTSHCT
jgi:hypothetical protein